MPMYEYMCQAGHVTVEYRSVFERERPTICHCHYISRKAIVTPPRVFSDYEGYESPVSGKWIEGKRARVEDLKENNCRPYEAGERQEFERRQVANERALDKTVDEVVEQSLEALTQHDEGSDARNQLMRG